jgi:hypothetical protein
MAESFARCERLIQPSLLNTSGCAEAAMADSILNSDPMDLSLSADGGGRPPAGSTLLSILLPANPISRPRWENRARSEANIKIPRHRPPGFGGLPPARRPMPRSRAVMMFQRVRPPLRIRGSRHAQGIPPGRPCSCRFQVALLAIKADISRQWTSPAARPQGAMTPSL